MLKYVLKKKKKLFVSAGIWCQVLECPKIEIDMLKLHACVLELTI